MRIVVASPFPPDPEANHGGAVLLGTFLRALSPQAEISVLSLAEAHGGDGAPALPWLARHQVIEHQHLAQLHGAQRARHKLRMLAAWRRRPLLAAKFWSPVFAKALQRLISEAGAEVVLLEFAMMAQYLPFIAGARTVLTDHENGEPRPIPIGPGGLGLRRDRALWTRYVRQHYQRAHLLQTLNPTDADTLTKIVGRPVEVRPAAVAIPPVAVDPGAAPQRALFLGNYVHPPNPHAAVVLAREVWPAVLRRCPSAELWLAGPGAPATVRELAELDGVKVTGATSDLAALFGQVRLLLAPVFTGGGVRIKVLTAMAHGLPVVSNQLGWRGMTAPDAVMRGAETPQALAECVANLLDDPMAATTSGLAARQWVSTYASPEALAATQLKRLQRLVDAD